MKLPPLNALRCFEAAARLLSLKLAASELCVTPSAVSQQIAVSIFNDQLVAFLCRFCVVPFVGTFRADVHAVIFVGVFGVAFWAVW